MGEWFPQLEQSRMAFVSIVAQSCREPFQRWNPDRKGTSSGGPPSSTNGLRFHRGPIMSSARRLPGPCRERSHRRRMIGCQRSAWDHFAKCLTNSYNMPSTYCNLGIILGPLRNHCGIILGQSWEHAYKIYTMYNYGTILGTCSPNSHNASMLETCRSSRQVCFSHFVLQVRTPPKNKSGDNNTDFQKPQNQKKAH